MAYRESNDHVTDDGTAVRQYGRLAILTTAWLDNLTGNGELCNHAARCL